MIAPLLAGLAAMSPAEIRALHERGTAPAPADLGEGALDGVVLTGRLSRFPARQLGLWRGKVIESAGAGEVAGRNRLGLGPLEVRRFRFTGYVGGSLFGDRDVLLLDHDHETNPGYVRRFHDELVQVDTGVFVATSHHRTRDGLRYLATFGLAVRR